MATIPTRITITFSSTSSESSSAETPVDIEPEPVRHPVAPPNTPCLRHRVIPHALRLAILQNGLRHNSSAPDVLNESANVQLGYALRTQQIMSGRMMATAQPNPSTRRTTRPIAQTTPSPPRLSYEQARARNIPYTFVENPRPRPIYRGPMAPRSFMRPRQSFRGSALPQSFTQSRLSYQGVAVPRSFMRAPTVRDTGNDGDTDEPPRQRRRLN